MFKPIKKNNEPLHIMHIQESLDIGGMENGIVNIANQRDKDRFAVSLCCINKVGSLADRINDNETKILCLHQKEGISVALIFRLNKLFRENKVDIVHTHNFYSGIYGIIAARLAGVPIIIHGEHGTLVLTNPIRIYVMIFLSLFVDKFFTVSSELRNDFLKKTGVSSNKIAVLVNGVDTKRFRVDITNTQLRDSLKIPSRNLIFGSIGRLVPVKNYQLLIQAKKRMDIAGLNTSCIITGSGPSRKNLELFARDIGTEVLFLGERNDIPNVLAMLDLFVLTSLSEGMSNTILEAMACGKPVIATRVGGNTELIEERKTGLLFSSNNLEELVIALLECINNREFALQLGHFARQTVEQKFSLNAMVKNYEQAYLSLAKNKGMLS